MDDIFPQVNTTKCDALKPAASVTFSQFLRFLRTYRVLTNRVTYVTIAHIWHKHSIGSGKIALDTLRANVEHLACVCFGWPPVVCDATQKFRDQLEEHYVQAPVSAGDRVLHNLTQPHAIQCLKNTTRTYTSRSCAPPKVTFEQLRRHNHLSVGIVVFITSSFNFHAEHSNSSSALLGNSWMAVATTSLRLTLRDNQAFLKSAGLILPPQSSSQTVQFGNEDASLLFRASHHASTSISAKQKALDAPDLGSCEFLEFLCRLSLAPNFKMLGDTTDEMRMQKHSLPSAMSRSITSLACTSESIACSAAHPSHANMHARVPLSSVASSC